MWYILTVFFLDVPNQSDPNSHLGPRSLNAMYIHLEHYIELYIYVMNLNKSSYSNCYSVNSFHLADILKACL